jgi:hypothetical protein
MLAAARAGVPAPNGLIHDLAPVFVFYQHGFIICDWFVDVYRNAAYSGGSFRKDEPLPPLVVGKI